jgi:integrase
VDIKDVFIFSQGVAAIAHRIKKFTGINMLVDIGNGTMNVFNINDKKLIHVERNVTYAHNQPEIGSTKTNSGKRSIPLDSRLAEFLKPHCSAGYVLGGAEPMTQMVFRRVFKHIQRNVELFGATPHIFRHTYITTLAKANVDLKTIQRISGHANITTTLNIYTHTREEEIQEAGDKIGELLGK